MNTINITNPRMIPDVIQARAFPLYDKRNGLNNGESLYITGLWEFEGGIFGYDFGKVTHGIPKAYIDEELMELVIGDEMLPADFIYENNVGIMNSSLRVVNRHTFLNVFEATGYYSMIQAIISQRERKEKMINAMS